MSSSTYHNTLVDLIFVRTVNIPNLSILLCLEVASPLKAASTKGRLPSKVVFHQRSSSIKGCLPSKGVFRQRSTSIKGRLPSKVVFHQSFLPSTVDYLILSVAQLSSAFHNLSAVADMLPSSSLSTSMNS